MLQHSAKETAGRFLVALLLLPIGLGLVPVRECLAQDGEVIEQNLGSVDINTLGILYPRVLFRPIDDLTPRAGARAQGMAGTYLGLATGAEALAWNPAGMAFSERSTICADFYVQSSSGSTSEFPLRLEQDLPGIPPLFISAYDQNLKNQVRFGFLGVSGTPFSLASRPVHLGLAYRRHTNVAYPEEVVSEFRFVEGTTTVPVVVAVDNKESGSIESATLGLAYQVIPGVGIGANANYLTGIWRTNFSTLINNPGGAAETGRGRFALDYEGISFDLGGRADLGALTVSGWVGLPHSVKVTNGSFRSETLELPSAPLIVFRARQGGYDLKVPMFYSLGAALKVNRRLTLAADFNSRPWGDAEVEYHKPELFKSPQNPWQDFNTSDFYPALDVQSFHGGLEYLLLRGDGFSVPVRLGFAFVPLSMANADPSDTLEIGLTIIPELEGPATILGGDGDPAFYGDDQPEAFVYSFGASLILEDVSFHGSFEARRYDFYRLFFESTGKRSGDFLINPNGRVGKIQRLESFVRISAEYRF